LRYLLTAAIELGIDRRMYDLKVIESNRGCREQRKRKRDRKG
jgi:hypothetical protein